MGQGNTSSGSSSVAMGGGNTSSSSSSVAMGRNNTASGVEAFALGSEVTAEGNASFAFGSQTANQAADPKISGDRSIVFFSDGGVANSNSTADFTESDKFALVGLDLVLSERQVDGAAQGCIRFNPTSDELEFSDDCTTYNAFNAIGGGSSLWTDNTNSISYNSAHFINVGQALPADLDLSLIHI